MGSYQDFLESTNSQPDSTTIGVSSEVVKSFAEDNFPRPVEFDEAVSDELCNLLESGNSLFKIAKLEGMPAVSTILRWCKEHPSFRAKYEAANDIFWELTMLGTFEELTAPVKASLGSTNELQRKKMIWDAAKLMASKFSRKFADGKTSATQVNVAGSSNVQVVDYSSASLKD